MYDLINAQTAVILQYPKLQSDVRDYDWLVQNLPQVAGAQFKAKYKEYWRMNVARLSPAYYNVYFQSLQSARLNPPTLTAVAANLYTTPTNAKGRSLQFSFATKLLHMVNPKTPIYDLEVAAFYFFEKPKSKRARPPFATQLWQQKLADYLSFHTFLVQEYDRVLHNKILHHAIQAFRQQFAPQYFTDERVIDLLIWAYVKLLKSGALTTGQLIYR